MVKLKGERHDELRPHTERTQNERKCVIFQMTFVNDTLFFEDGLAGMAFMMEIGEENGEGNA